MSILSAAHLYCLPAGCSCVSLRIRYAVIKVPHNVILYTIILYIKIYILSASKTFTVQLNPGGLNDCSGVMMSPSLHPLLAIDVLNAPYTDR